MSFYGVRSVVARQRLEPLSGSFNTPPSFGLPYVDKDVQVTVWFNTAYTIDKTLSLILTRDCARHFADNIIQPSPRRPFSTYQTTSPRTTSETTSLMQYDVPIITSSNILIFGIGGGCRTDMVAQGPEDES